MKRVVGLDSIRFVLAFIVLLGHGALPSFSDNLIAQSKIVHYLDILMKLLQPNGAAAVMCFFIISGFVIHYPYSQSVIGGGKTLNILEFYSRRIIRIGIPALIALCIYHFTAGLFMGVIWSLICEIIYYLLYPLILRYKNKYMKTILISSFVMSYILTVLYSIFSNESNVDIHRNGFLLTWIVGLPVWLLGVVLADQCNSIQNQSETITYKKLWLSRIIIYVIASFMLLLKFHAHIACGYNIAYGYTFPVFSIFAYFWIKNEIVYYKDKQENRLLKYGGLMSYSLYLIHAYILFWVGYYSHIEPLSSNWILCLLAIILSLAASLVFYILIEKPSHKLARFIKVNNN
jgi:peptidoglycan/LPS O-acetylase OafA/YrhL